MRAHVSACQDEYNSHNQGLIKGKKMTCVTYELQHKAMCVVKSVLTNMPMFCFKVNVCASIRSVVA